MKDQRRETAARDCCKYARTLHYYVYSCSFMKHYCRLIFLSPSALPKNSRNHQNSLKWSIYQVALWNIFRFFSFLYISKDTKPVNTFWRCLMSHFSTKWSLNFGRQTIEKSFGPFGKNHKWLSKWTWLELKGRWTEVTKQNSGRSRFFYSGKNPEQFFLLRSSLRHTPAGIKLLRHTFQGT